MVNRGREPGLELAGGEGSVPLQHWADALIGAMQGSAALLDACHGGRDYAESLALQQSKVSGESETPSARVLREMREQGLPYYRFALGYSNRWSEHFKQRPLDTAEAEALQAESEASLARQRDIEAADTLSFEDYLAAYYRQYEAIQAGG